MLQSEVRVGERTCFSDLIVGRPGQADAARLCDALQARRHVHAVSEQVAPSHDHIADVHADAEPQTTVLLKALVRIAELLLNRDRALNRVNSTREFGKHAVTGGVGDPASVLGDKPVHDLTVSR